MTGVDDVAGMTGVDDVAGMTGVDDMAGMTGVDDVATDGWLVAAVRLLTILFNDIGDGNVRYCGDRDGAAAIPEVNTNFSSSSILLILLSIPSSRRF